MKAREAFLWNGLAVYTKRCVIVQQTAHIHHSRPDPQTGPKCDLNYSPLIDAAVLQSKGDKTWEQFLFLKIQLTLEYFPCCCPTLQGQEVFFALGTKTFPITSAALLCNLRGNRVWYWDNWGERRG